MARDLAAEPDFNVTVADRDGERLDRLRAEFPVTAMQRDLSDPETVRSLAAGQDLVINAMPGFLGYRTLQAVLEAGRNVVDIAFFEEDPFALDALARERSAIAVVDCGVSPGMSNILISHAHHQLDETDDALILVGGLPQTRTWPFEYKAVFSPADVIEEYTRPARLVENGQVVVKPALSECERMDFPRVGTLEAFNSDGLRTLLTTIPAKNMREKTLRYPGHAEKMALFRETGLFRTDEIEVNGQRVRPLDLTSHLLFKEWKLEAGEADLTIMRVVVEGRKNGVRRRHTYDLFDTWDAATRTHSMARTTGYTATVTARMIVDGVFTRTGISAPEAIGAQPACVDFLLAGLKERGVVYEQRVERLEG